jgi:hypothetical protein
MLIKNSAVVYCDLYEKILDFIPKKGKNKEFIVNRCEQCTKEDSIYKILKDLEV